MTDRHNHHGPYGNLTPSQALALGAAAAATRRTARAVEHRNWLDSLTDEELAVYREEQARQRDRVRAREAILALLRTGKHTVADVRVGQHVTLAFRLDPLEYDTLENIELVSGPVTEIERTVLGRYRLTVEGHRPCKVRASKGVLIYEDP